MGSFIAVTNPPVYDFADFLNDNMAKITGVALSWLAFAILRLDRMHGKVAAIFAPCAGILSISSADTHHSVKTNLNR